jgi:hypothetical protein
MPYLHQQRWKDVHNQVWPQIPPLMLEDVGKEKAEKCRSHMPYVQS